MACSKHKGDRLAWFKSSYSSGEGGECVEVALGWRKSSYSAGDGGECLEVAVGWHKSSYSAGDGGQCVEVAVCPRVIHVRDSKDISLPGLAVGAAAWSDFVRFAVG